MPALRVRHATETFSQDPHAPKAADVLYRLFKKYGLLDPLTPEEAAWQRELIAAEAAAEQDQIAA